MDDLISRQAAIELIEGIETERLKGNIELIYAPAIKGLRALPPADPKRGKWIPVDSYSAFGGDEATWMAHGNPVAFYYCSECKEQAYAGEDGESLITDYCPNCGAKMEVAE